MRSPSHGFFAAFVVVALMLLSVACFPHAASRGKTTPNASSPRDADRRERSPAAPVTPASSARDTTWTIQQPLTGRVRSCEHGKIEVFDCQRVELLAFLPVGDLGVPAKGRLTDLWGWTDPESGREFVLLARTLGTAFVEITDPLHPIYLGELPYYTARDTVPSRSWERKGARDIKVYRNHAFIVAEGRKPPHGMQIFDLTQLRQVTDPPITFRETTRYHGIAAAHNIAINEATGFAYTVGNHSGGETCGGGLHMVDIRDPKDPTFAGCHAETFAGSRQSGRIHDTQCVRYGGPDQQYRGKEICLNSAEKALTIVDVSEKQHPKVISIATYPNIGWVHQGWLSATSCWGTSRTNGRVCCGVPP